MTIDKEKNTDKKQIMSKDAEKKVDAVVVQADSARHSIDFNLKIDTTPQVIPQQKKQTGCAIKPVERSDEKTIRDYNINKQYFQIKSEQYLHSMIQNERQLLLARTPKPLQNGPDITRCMPSINLPPKLLNFAHQLQATNGLNVIGISYFILGSLAAATWGRVRLKLTETWFMSTALMFVQVSRAGTQKSFVISQLRKPYDDFLKNRKRETLSASQVKAYKKALRIAQKEKERDLTEYLKNAGITADTVENMCEDLEHFEVEIQHISEALNNTIYSLLTERTTPLGLALRLQAHGEAGACIMAEGDFISRMLLEKSSEPSFFNQCYDQEPYSADISRKRVELTHPYFCMLCFTQPHVLQKLLRKEELKTAGTMARIFPFFHTEQAYKPSIGHTVYDDDKEYASKITSLLNQYYTQDADAEIYTVNLSNEALDLVYAYKHEFKDLNFDFLPEVKAVVSKLPGQAVRLAWAIHAWNNDIPHESDITRYEMEVAVQLCKTLQDHIEYCYSPDGFQAYENAIKIMESLENIGTEVGNETLHFGYIKSRELQQRTHIRSKDMLPALKLLEKHNWIKLCDNGKRSYIVILRNDSRYFPLI